MNIHVREHERLAALDRYDVLDTPPEEAFDRVTRLIRRLFDVPIATVALIDGHRRWLRTGQGASGSEVPRSMSFCSLSIQQTRPLIIPDTLLDERTAQNPFVVGKPHIRFYAGAPLQTSDGHNIGTVCAIDTKPRTFGAEESNLLSDLARIVMTELDSGRLPPRTV